MNEYRNILTGDAASAWKRLVGRFYWLNDGDIVKHLIEVHEQWCGDQCPLQKSCDQHKAGSERSSDRPDVIPSTQSSGENKNISLQLEVDEGAESVDDDSSNDGYRDPASEEEGDIKQEPNALGYTVQNAETTHQTGGDLLPLCTDSGGDHPSQTIPVVKQEPTDNGEYGNSVTQSVETTQTKTVSYDSTQLTSSGAASHSVMSDPNVGVVKQEPVDSCECESSVSQSGATSERTVSHHCSPPPLSSAPVLQTALPTNIVTSFYAPVLQPAMSNNIVTSFGAPVLQSSNIVTSSGDPTSFSVVSTNTVTSVKSSVIQGMPSTVNTLGTGTQPLIPINVAQTPFPAVQNPAVIGAQTLLPAQPGSTQTINLATSGNVASPQLFNVVRRGDSLFLESATAPTPSILTPNLQNPSFTLTHPMGLNLQSASSLPPTVPVAANIASNVGQGGSLPIQPMLVSGGQQVSTSSESPSVPDPVTTAVKQETPSTNTPTGSHNRGADDKQTDEDCKQMDVKNEALENSQTVCVKRRLSETEEGPGPSKRFVTETGEEDQSKDANVNELRISPSEGKIAARVLRKIAGVLDVGGENTSILHSDTPVTFSISFGQSSSSYVQNADEIYTPYQPEPYTSHQPGQTEGYTQQQPDSYNTDFDGPCTSYMFQLESKSPHPFKTQQKDKKPLLKDANDPPKYAGVLVDKRKEHENLMLAKSSKTPGIHLLNSVLGLVFPDEVLAGSSGMGLKRNRENAEKPVLDSLKLEAIREYVNYHCKHNGWEGVSFLAFNNTVTNKIGNKRKKMKKSTKLINKISH